MDFTFSEEQIEIRAFAHELLARLAAKFVAADGSYHTADQGPEWSDLAASDLLAIGLPESVGGAGGGMIEQCLIAAEFGRSGLLVRYDASIVAASAVATLGTHPGHHAPLSAFLVGVATIGLVAGDPKEIAGALAVTPTESGWLVSGQVRHATAVTERDSLLVPLELDGSRVFALIDLGRRGIVRENVVATDLSHSSHLRLNEVAVTRIDLVGEPGLDAWSWVQQRALALSCATQLGICTAALDLATRHVHQRQQFGRVLSDFQAVTQRLADAHIQLQVLEVSMWRLATLLSQEKDSQAEAHLAKYLAAIAAPAVIRAAVHLHGGLGVDSSYPLTRLVLTSKRSELWMGGEGVHLEQLSRLIGDAETLDSLLTV